MSTATPAPTSPIPAASWPLARVWAVAAVALIAVSFPLWFPLTDFPVVPLWESSLTRSPAVSTFAAVVLISALLWIIVRPFGSQRRWWLVAGGLVVAFICDQHRLQPWAYQTAIYAAVFAGVPVARQRRWIIPVAASVYLYSAAGKFDYQFAYTVGQDFLDAATSWFGGLPQDWSPKTRAGLSLALPASEFAAGIGVLFPLTRKLAGCGLIAMHMTLFVILGPLMLDHSHGVLVWNLALATQAWFLFVRPNAGPSLPIPATGQRDPQRQSEQLHPWGTIVAGAAVCVALIGPLGERSGHWDHWLSWALYSPHNSRVDCEVHDTVVNQLPQSLQNHVVEDTDGDRWRKLDLGSWSLGTLGVPVYPQSRYQLQLVGQVAREAGLDDGIRARVRSVSDRWTGERETTPLMGQREISTGRPQR